MKGNTVEWINTLGAFCGVRDVPTLTKDALNQNSAFGKPMGWFFLGGAFFAGANYLLRQWKNRVPKNKGLVGGPEKRKKN